MTAVQPDVWDMLAAIDGDPVQQTVPTQRDYRDDIRRAVALAAAEHKGLVHASWIRPHLPADVPPHLVGAVVAGLHTTGHLAPSNRPALPNGGPSGNASKLSKGLAARPPDLTPPRRTAPSAKSRAARQHLKEIV